MPSPERSFTGPEPEPNRGGLDGPEDPDLGEPDSNNPSPEHVSAERGQPERLNPRNFEPQDLEPGVLAPLSFEPPRGELGGANTDLLQLVAAAADLCRRPLRHGVVAVGAVPQEPEAALEACLRLEARTPDGERRPEHDLELEIYPSGADLHLTLAWCHDDSRPMLWQGQHPVWMDTSGARCPPPEAGAPIEALARRLRALLVNV